MFSADLGGYTPSLPAATDPPFQKVALLLHGDGTNGAQNNTFVDYSYPGGYAVSFDGSGDYLSTPSITIGSGDFTIECWAYQPSITSYPCLFTVGDSKLSTGIEFQIWSSHGQIYGNNSTIYYSTDSGWGTLTTWIHYAIVRSGSTLTVYRNGISLGTATYTQSISGVVRIGCEYYNSGVDNYWTGYISNFRIATTALYTSNFTPSNQPLTAVSGTQLLTCQSATIVDNSPNAFTITANGDAAAVSSKTITRTGNVAQGTFSPFSLAEGQWSNYFDGSGDYLTTAASSSLDCTGDFTFECYFYLTANVADYRMFISNASSNDTYIALKSGGTGGLLQLVAGGVDQANLSLNNSVVPNTWNHIAVVRSGTTLTGYINGVSLGSVTSSANFAFSNAQGASIGKWGGGAQYWTGYLSNARLVKGTAVYTSNFTPPTSALTAITNTSLLTCQSNRFKDNSSNNFTITPYGDTKVTAFSPFAPSAAYSASTNGGSGYFDGSGDYLSVADNANLRFGTSAFTIQAWVYRNAAGTAHSIVSKGGASTGFTLGITSTNILRFTDTTTNIDTTTTIPAGTWTHVAAVRTNTSTNGFQLYINGVSSKTATVSTDFNQTDTLYVGADRGAANVMNGYITDLRYVNGTAETIAVPTAPLTTVTNTQLLLNCTNAGIIDNAGKNDIETVGNAQISTSVKKYGTGSMYFDGTGDWLYLADKPELQLGTGNFTIEGWLYLGATGSARGVVGKGTSTTGWLLSTNTSNQVVFTYGSSTITSTGTLSGSTWYHIAVCREGTGTNQTKIYINGSNDGTGTVITNFNQTNVMYVGADRTGGSAMNGYIDDLRITLGQALYTSNFTPPTQAFPNV